MKLRRFSVLTFVVLAVFGMEFALAVLVVGTVLSLPFPDWFRAAFGLAALAALVGAGATLWVGLVDDE